MITSRITDSAIVSARALFFSVLFTHCTAARYTRSDNITPNSIPIIFIRYAVEKTVFSDNSILYGYIMTSGKE